MHPGRRYLKRLRSCLPQQLPELLNFGGEVTAFCCVTEPKRGHFHEQCPQPRGAGTATSEMPPSLRLSSRTVAPWHGFPCRREIFPPGLVFSEGTIKSLRQRARPSGARSGLLEPSSAAPAAPRWSWLRREDGTRRSAADNCASARQQHLPCNTGKAFSPAPAFKWHLRIANPVAVDFHMSNYNPNLCAAT